MRQGNSLVLAIASLAIVAALWAAMQNLSKEPNILPEDPDYDGPRATLVVHTAAGIKGPMAELALAYERAYGVAVELRYGGTGTLLGNITLDPSEGDAFLSADDKHLGIAHDKGLVAERIDVAQQNLVLAVAAGNPKGITSIADLLREDVRFAMANPETAAVGTLTKAALTETGQWDAVMDAVTVTKPTVTDLATDLQTGAVDAVMIWDSTVAILQRKDFAVETVAIPAFADSTSNVSIGILSKSEQATMALHFSRWISSPERGAPVFRKHGFAAEGGDRWTERPELVFYSGSVNRPAIEKALQIFSDREGVSIATSFNGCGILCADMLSLAERSKTMPDIRVPDGYYACDICFIEPVQHLYPEAVIMTETDIVIAVPKGNPKNIQSLYDLAQPELRLGISNAEQATLGFMTKRLFAQTNLTDAVRPNVKLENPQADFLINHLATGSLDAAIVYAVNVGEHIKYFDLIPIDHAGALAVQPFATSYPPRIPPSWTACWRT